MALFAWYKLEDNTDNEKGTYTAVLRNGATYTDVKIGKGLTLDGLNDYMNIAHHTDFEYYGGEFSFSCWLYHDSTDTDGGYVVSHPWNGSGQYNYRLRVYNNTIALYMDGQDSIGGVDSWYTGYQGTLSQDEMHQVGFVFGVDKVVKLYIDGVNVYSGQHDLYSHEPTLGDLNYAVAVGTLYPYSEGWAGNTAFSFGGDMDEVRFYNHALSDKEMREIWKAKVLHLKFNNHTGVPKDCSEYANHPASMTASIDDSKYKIGTGSLDSAGHTDAVIVGNDISLSTIRDVTIGYWIYANNFTLRTNPFGKAFGGEGTQTLELNGSISYYWGDNGGNAANYTAHTLNVTYIPTLLAWTHILTVRTVTPNGANWDIVTKWYRNGLLVETDSTIAYSYAPTRGTLNFTVGDNYVSPVDGWMDDFRVYQTALEQIDIDEIYQGRASLDSEGNFYA